MIYHMYLFKVTLFSDIGSVFSIYFWQFSCAEYSNLQDGQQQKHADSFVCMHCFKRFVRQSDRSRSFLMRSASP